MILFPSVEFGFGGSFIKSSLANTTIQMLHQHHTFARQDVTHRVGWLCAGFNPVESTLKIQIYRGVFCVWIVRSNFFNKLTCSRCVYVCKKKKKKGVAFTTVTLQSNFCCHNL